MTTTTIFERAIELRDLLNAGSPIRSALHLTGFDPDDVYGEDIGDECLEVDDPQSDVIDLGWHGTATRVGVTPVLGAGTTHYQIRRLGNLQPWTVEVMQRFEPEPVTTTIEGN